MIDPKKQYTFLTNLKTGREKSINATITVLLAEGNIYFLLEHEDKRYLKLCINNDTKTLLYFESYDEYVDFNYLNEIIGKVYKELESNKSIIISDKNIDVVKKFDISVESFSINKNELSYCFNDEKYNYTDGIKFIKYYSELGECNKNISKENMLFLIKYGNKYEYCIMDDNLNKIVKFVFEKNIDNGKFYLVRKENYLESSREYSFEDFNEEFRKSSDNKDNRLKDTDVPGRHGSCGFHFYHFFSISDYFEEITNLTNR